MIRCIKLKPCAKNTLRAFVDLELTRVGLILRNCTWHRHENGKEWVGLPAKPWETKTGATAWQAVVEFAPGATAAREQFQRQALAAIHVVAGENVEAA